jgi:photosystem II stability/assembly factor-like uncharacterized protein
VLKTADGGETWINLQSGTTSQLNSVFCTDASTVYVVGGDTYGGAGIILKTVDGGATWVHQYDQSEILLWSIRFLDAQTGVTVGGENSGVGSTILRTTNGGTDWVDQKCKAGQTLYSVHFTGGGNGYTVGYAGTILKTTDGGIGWTGVPSGTNNGLFAVCIADTAAAYAVGGGGTILSTAAGGSTGMESEPQVRTTDFDLRQNYPNPFNPSTVIAFRLARRSAVDLRVYDALGREVAVLAEGVLDAGYHSTRFDAASRGSGVYYYRLTAGGTSIARRMACIK